MLAFALAAIVAAGCRGADGGSRANADADIAMMAAMDRRLPGVWRGTGPCDGQLTVRAEGTYERAHYSPGDNHVSGRWTVKRDGGRPVLVMTCDAADNADDVGGIGSISEVEIVRVDADVLEYRAAGQQSATRYERAAE
jgi:hypothetical protein